MCNCHRIGVTEKDQSSHEQANQTLFQCITATQALTVWIEIFVFRARRKNSFKNHFYVWINVLIASTQRLMNRDIAFCLVLHPKLVQTLLIVFAVEYQNVCHVRCSTLFVIFLYLRTQSWDQFKWTRVRTYIWIESSTYLKPERVKHRKFKINMLVWSRIMTNAYILLMFHSLGLK